MSSSTPKEKGDTILAIGQERVSVKATSSRLSSDIQFLRDRIERMKQFNKPNKATLKIYEDMLKNREAIYDWLEEHHGNNEAPSESRTG